MRTVQGLVRKMNEHIASAKEKIEAAFSNRIDHRFLIVDRAVKKRNGHVKKVDPAMSRRSLSYSLCMLSGVMIVPMGVSYWNNQRSGIPDHWIFAYGYNLVTTNGGYNVEIYAHDVGRALVYSEKSGLTAEQYLAAISKNQHVTLYVDSNGGRIFKSGPHNVRPVTAGGYDIVEIGMPYLPIEVPNT
jgi:hypothetical protein